MAHRQSAIPGRVILRLTTGGSGNGCQTRRDEASEIVRILRGTVTGPIQPSDPWARPPRQRDNKKRRWPLVVGIGVGSVVGLSVIGVLAEDNSPPEPQTTTTSSSRIARPSTTTNTSPTTTSAVASTVSSAPTIVPTTTVEVPIVPATTIQLPPPVEAPLPPTTLEVPTPRASVSASQTPPSAYYKNCDAAKAAGAAPIYIGEPGYRPELDRNKDGVACEEG
ncbi:excalibur calcium-binding domain-containing protein [Nocardia fluminea]